MSSHVPTPPRPLFRQEVIAFQQQDRQWGRVVPMQPLRTRLMVWFLIASAAAIVGFLFLAEYARKETAVGYLTPAAGTARVFAPSPGIVSARHVEQGQMVAAGDPLVSVSTTRIAANGEDVDAAILDSLARLKDQLHRQIATEERRTESERARLDAQLRGIEAELGHLGTQLAVQLERIALVERIVGSGAALSRRGLVSELDQRRREEALLEQRLALTVLRQQVATRENQRTETRFALEQLPFVQAEKIQALRNDLAAAEQRAAEVEGRRAYVIRAPVGGRVASLQAAPGQPADPQRLLVQIIPEGGPLRAELFIPARAIGFIEVGQPVRILYEAFPYQHFGSHRGRIESVSRAMLTTAEAAGPITLAGPAYRAIVALDRADIDAYGRKVPLQPDMLLRADVILERRTLMDWILDPLLSARVAG